MPTLKGNKKTLINTKNNGNPLDNIDTSYDDEYDESDITFHKDEKKKVTETGNDGEVDEDDEDEGNDEEEDDEEEGDNEEIKDENESDDDSDKNTSDTENTGATNITINKKSNPKNKSKCVYDYLSDGDDENELFDEDVNIESNEDVVIDSNKRITKPFLTDFERVRLLGERTQQLTLDAKPMIKNVDKLEPFEIAKLELKEKMIPLKIERPLPGGKKEIWYLRELEL